MQGFGIIDYDGKMYKRTQHAGVGQSGIEACAPPPLQPAGRGGGVAVPHSQLDQCLFSATLFLYAPMIVNL